MQDKLPTQLGGLAANLARIASISKNPDNWEVVDSLLEESKYFIEWMISNATLNELILLAEIQRQLAFWHSLWPQIHTNEIECETIRQYSQKWSKDLLKMAQFI